MPKAQFFIGRVLVCSQWFGRGEGFPDRREIFSQAFGRPNEYAAAGAGEFNFFRCKAIEELQVDRLLNIHIGIVISRLHDVDDLEINRRFAEFREMRAIQFGFFDRPYNLFYDLGDELELLGAAIINNSEAENDAPGLHAFEVLNFRFDEFFIRKDQLLTRKTGNATGFQADAFHGSHLVADDYEVSHLKRLIQNNRQGCKDIAENILNRQSNRDTADAQTCNQGADIDAQVVEQEEEEHGPKKKLRGYAHRAVGGKVNFGYRLTLSRVATQITPKRKGDQFIPPNRRLKEDGNLHGISKKGYGAVREVQDQGTCDKKNESYENLTRLFEADRYEVIPGPLRGFCVNFHPLYQEPEGGHDDKVEHTAENKEREPLGQRVIQVSRFIKGIWPLHGYSSSKEQARTAPPGRSWQLAEQGGFIIHPIFQVELKAVRRDGTFLKRRRHKGLIESFRNVPKHYFAASYFFEI